MKIGIGNDHHGVLIKEKIKKYLHDNNISCIDFGSNTTDKVNYIDYAKKVCNAVNNKEIDYGILICGTGIGMSMAANKINGIRCAKVTNVNEAMHTRNDNFANVLALGEDIQNVEQIIETFINTPNSNEERHIQRVNDMMKLEVENHIKNSI